MLTGVISLALSEEHSMILKQDGSVWSTVITLNSSHIRARAFGKTFRQIIPNGAIAVAASTGYSMALTHDGSVWVISQNVGAQNVEHEFRDIMRFGKDTFYFQVVQVIPGAKAVAAGGYHSMVVTEGGKVWVMGWNTYGQLGDGLTTYTNSFFAAISSGAGVVAVAAGDHHSIVLKQDGSVWAAGRNHHGQLGDGSVSDRNRFVKVVSDGAADVTAGTDHSLVLKQDGSVWATGWNEYGQLGDGTATDRVNFVQAISSGAKAISAGRRHSMILKEDGSVWATGGNEHGQLGDGSTINSKVYFEVIFGGAKYVAVGAFHSIMIKEDGSIWATGLNKNGQFGDTSTISRSSFVRLPPLKNG